MVDNALAVLTFYHTEANIAKLCPWMWACQRKPCFFISMMALAMTLSSCQPIKLWTYFHLTLLNIALMLRSSVYLRPLLDAPPFQICWEVLLLDEGFFSISKEMQSGANWLSLTYSLSCEPFGPPLLISMAAKGSTGASILKFE